MTVGRCQAQAGDDPARDDPVPRHRNAEPWLEGCRLGDAAAWSDVYRSCAPAIAVYLRRLIGPVPEVDDLAQQVFVNAMTSIGRFRGDSRMSTWLYGIATHVAEGHLRWRFRWRRRDTEYGDWMNALDEVTPDVSCGQQARAVLRVMTRALDRMKPRRRAAWVLRECEGLDSEETAAALGIPVGTVRSRLFQARREIAQALYDAGFSEEAVAAVSRIVEPTGDPVPARDKDRGRPCTPARK